MKLRATEVYFDKLLDKTVYIGEEIECDEERAKKLIIDDRLTRNK